MINPQDLRLYLPKYLSPTTEQKLLDDLNLFPENIDQRIYGFVGKESGLLYQGDCLKNLPFINLPDTKIKNVNSVIISNTCDTDNRNKRKYNTNLLYAPLLSLLKYKNLLLMNKVISITSIDNHIEQIRKQKITQIHYFPIGQGNTEEKIIFFDQICHCQRKFINNDSINDSRLFSLSQYGFYLFLYKLSIHFTRFHEKVDRKY